MNAVTIAMLYEMAEVAIYIALLLFVLVEMLLERRAEKGGKP
mgnify:CR=1 FL=1